MVLYYYSESPSMFPTAEGSMMPSLEASKEPSEYPSIQNLPTVCLRWVQDQIVDIYVRIVFYFAIC